MCFTGTICVGENTWNPAEKTRRVCWWNDCMKLVWHEMTVTSPIIEWIMKFGCCSSNFAKAAISPSALRMFPLLIFWCSLLTHWAFTRTSDISATDSPGPWMLGSLTVNWRGPALRWDLTISSNQSCSWGRRWSTWIGQQCTWNPVLEKWTPSDHVCRTKTTLQVLCFRVASHLQAFWSCLSFILVCGQITILQSGSSHSMTPRQRHVDLFPASKVRASFFSYGHLRSLSLPRVLVISPALQTPFL